MAVQMLMLQNPIGWIGAFWSEMTGVCQKGTKKYIFNVLFNTPDLDNQLVTRDLNEWTVFRLTCSLLSVYCSLLPVHGKSAKVYFT